MRSADAHLSQELVPGAILLAFVVFLSSFAGAKKFAMKAAHGRPCICTYCPCHRCFDAQGWLPDPSLQRAHGARIRKLPWRLLWLCANTGGPQPSLGPKRASFRKRVERVRRSENAQVEAWGSPTRPESLSSVESLCAGPWEAGIKSQLGANVLVGATCRHSGSFRCPRIQRAE